MDIFSDLDDEKFTQLLEICFRFLSGEFQPSQFLSLLKKFSDNVNIELSVIEPVIKSLLKLLKDATKASKTLTQLQDDLKKLGFSERDIQIFISKWEKYSPKLLQVSSATTFEVNPLIDMEWKFGVTSASSELNSIGNVFLHLKLVLDNGNSKQENVCFELQLPEFYAFLHEMERARASLEYLT